MKDKKLTVFFMFEIFTGLQQFLCRKVSAPQGMPAIYYTWKGYVKSGHKIHIFTQDSNYEGYSDWEYNKWQLHNVPAPFKYLRKHRFTKLGKFLHRISRLIGLYRVWKRALAVAKENPPDVVYSYSAWSSLVAMFVARKYNAVHVIRRFGTFLYDVLVGWKRLWTNDQRIIEALCYRLSYDLVVMANDGTCGDKACLHYGCPQSKLVFWTNGIDKDMYNPDCDRKKFRKDLDLPDDCPIVLSVSHLGGMKRVDRVIKVMTYVEKARPDARLVIVGDGFGEQELKRFAKECGVEDITLFVGRVTHSEVKRYFNCSDVFVQLYDRSNRSNPLFEAMCCRLPIVTFDGLSTADLIFHEKTALCIKSNTILQEKPVECVESEELKKAAEYVVTLLGDEQLRLKLGRNARDCVINTLQTWEQRIEMEVNKVLEVVEEQREKQ